MNTTKEFFFGGVFSVMAYQRLPLHKGALNRRSSADRGSGIRPIWRGGRPCAMLAPDASVGKAENVV